MGIFCTSAAVIAKAGADVDPDLNTEYEAYFIPQAEAYINCHCRYNYSDSYASLNSDARTILAAVCSDLAAIYAINFSHLEHGSTMVAMNMINTLRNSAERGLKILEDDKHRSFIIDA